jgi:G3E family GTPase
MAVPVTLVTGYLGAGKTTLLNRILTADHGLRIAVIVNEFGEIGIDGDLVVNVEEEIVTLANGCICCTLREDLVEAVEGIIDRSARPDHLVVETSGVADPSSTMMTFLSHPDAGELFTLDGVVAVVDALNLRQQLDRSPEVRAQIAVADTILLNKCDLVDVAALDDLEELIGSINPTATVERTVRAGTDVQDLLDIRTFDSGRAIESMERLKRPIARATHEEGIAAASIIVDGDLDPEKFDRWVEALIEARHEDLYRLKGIIALAGSPRRYIIQAVHALSTWQYGVAWEDSPRRSRIVVIGRGFDGQHLRRDLEGCRAVIEKG